MLPLLSEHQGHVKLRLRSGGSGVSPDEVHVLEFASQEAFDGYLSDPRRVALAEEGDSAVARTEVYRMDQVTRARRAVPPKSLDRPWVDHIRSPGKGRLVLGRKAPCRRGGVRRR